MHVAPAARTAISALKGNPFGRATRQAQRLGSTLHPDRRPCAPQELDPLLGKVSPIAKRLKRSETSVVIKIKALGHSRRLTEGYTVRDLELCLGEDHRKIEKWIANGLLRNGSQGARRHNGHDIHRFREKEILNFIKGHPQEINLGKVDQTCFLDLVLLRGMELRGTGQTNPSVEMDEDGSKQNNSRIVTRAGTLHHSGAIPQARLRAAVPCLPFLDRQQPSI